MGSPPHGSVKCRSQDTMAELVRNSFELVREVPASSYHASRNDSVRDGSNPDDAIEAAFGALDEESRNSKWLIVTIMLYVLI